MIAEPINDDVRATARVLAEAAREAEPAMLKILLFPSVEEIRLLYVDATAHPAGWGTWNDAEVLWEKA